VGQVVVASLVAAVAAAAAVAGKRLTPGVKAGAIQLPQPLF